MGFGYKQQKFDYRVYNVHQWLVGVPNSDQYVNDVTALTYNSVESIPYLSVGFIKDWSSLSIGFETQFSLFVSYKGHDNHVLRSKHINFSGKGQYVNIAINLQYETLRRIGRCRWATHILILKRMVNILKHVMPLHRRSKAY